MGSLFCQGKNIPVPSAPKELMLVRDNENKLERVSVNRQDGSVSYFICSTPPSAAEQAVKDELNSIMSEALAEIKKLSATDYADDAETQKVLQNARIKV